jgi:hypothetical protein
VTTMIDKWFGIPQRLVRGGIWADMTPSEQGMYVWLLHESERYHSREFTRPDAQLCAAMGVSSRSVCDARKKIQERGLVICERATGNVYRYVICNPETRQPYPGDPKVRVDLPKKRSLEPDGDGLAQQAAPPPVEHRQSSQPCADDLRNSKPLENYGLPGVF